MASYNQEEDGLPHKEVCEASSASDATTYSSQFLYDPSHWVSQLHWMLAFSKRGNILPRVRKGGGLLLHSVTVTNKSLAYVYAPSYCLVVKLNT